MNAYPRKYDMVDLLMPACEKMGYGVHYGDFIANTTPEERQKLAEKERRRRERKRRREEERLEKENAK